MCHSPKPRTSSDEGLRRCEPQSVSRACDNRLPCAHRRAATASSSRRWYAAYQMGVDMGFVPFLAQSLIKNDEFVEDLARFAEGNFSEAQVRKTALLRSISSGTNALTGASFF